MYVKYKKTVIFIVTLVIVSLFLYLMIHYERRLVMMNIRYVRAFISSFIRRSGKVTIGIVFVLLYSLKPVLLVIPASLLSIFAGNIFGPYVAFALSMVGCFFSATLSFYLARWLGQPFVNKLLKGKALKMDDQVEKHGFKIMLLMRLSMIFPYDALGFASGLSKMNYGDFILGTVLGIIPEIFTYSYMGKHLKKPFSLKFILPIVAAVIIAYAASRWYKSDRKNND